jgi:hypothetical protein
MEKPGDVVVEFFGVPRLKAGYCQMRVSAGRLVDVLAAVERACPGLGGLVQADGSLARAYLLSIEGKTFIKDLNHSVRPGEQVLLLSADAGG